MAQRTKTDRNAKVRRDIVRERRQYVRAIKATAEHAHPDYFPDAAELIAQDHGRDSSATEQHINQFANKGMNQ